MKKEISIAIKKPCSQSWDNFQPTTEGAFCSSCQKNVVDFAGMGDQELIQYMQKSNGRVCGRLNTNQLKIYSNNPKKAKKGFFQLIRAGIMSLTLLMLSKPAVSMASSVKTPTYQTIADTAKIESSVHLSNQIVSGRVVDVDSEEGLPHVNVLLKGTKIGVNTDLDGYFTFPKALKAGDVLVFSAIGMARTEYRVPKSEVKNLVIEMLMDIQQLGEVSIYGAFTENAPKPSLWQRVASWF